ncbi:MAG: hypothetical protein ACO3LE_06995 [Bdellovibrionota bacterium]
MMKKKVLIASDSLKIQRQAASCFNPEVYDLIFAQEAHDTLIKIERMRPEYLFIDEELKALNREQLSEVLGRLSSVDLFWFGESSDFKASSFCRVHFVAKPFKAKTLLETLMAITEEEATPVKSMIDEVSGVDEITRKTQLDENSNGPFSSFRKVVGVDEPTPVEEVTLKVKPQNFKHPVNAKPSVAEPKPISSVDESSAPEPEEFARQKIEEWVQANLPALAERLIKEEIAKRFVS